MKHQHLFRRIRTLANTNTQGEALYEITCACGIQGTEYRGGGCSWREDGVDCWAANMTTLCDRPLLDAVDTAEAGAK